MPQKPKILIVESDPALLQILETTLNLMGMEPCCVPNAKEALFLVEQEKFAGAFLDWNNPGMDGKELTQQIRSSKSNSKIPIAMLAEQSDIRANTTGFAVGVTFYLAKPFGEKQLRHLLNATRGTMLEEQRRYQRIPLSVPATCEWQQDKGLKRAAGKTTNISCTGLVMIVSPQPGMGVAAMLALLLPQLKKTFTPKALVKRIAPGNEVAFEFVNFLGQDREMLESYLNRYSTSSRA